MGIINKDSKNIIMMFMEATIPNSRNKLLLVSVKVAKPHAVVMLVISVALPTLEITR